MRGGGAAGDVAVGVVIQRADRRPAAGEDPADRALLVGDEEARVGGAGRAGAPAAVLGKDLIVPARPRAPHVAVDHAGGVLTVEDQGNIA